MNYTFRPIENWPRPKNKSHKRAVFRSRYGQTLQLLEKELRYIQARKIVIQIDIPESQIRLDGLPYSKARPIFQGVIVSFDSKYGPLRYMTDVFDNWQDNLRAIALGLEALRKVDRYGVTKKGEQYVGWKQLPAGTDSVNDLHSAAAFVAEHSDYTPLDILSNDETRKKAYRIAAAKLHPDKGGDIEEFKKLQKAKEYLFN